MERTNTHEDSREIVAIPYKIIQDALKRKVSGRLTIQDPNDFSVKWQIYLGDGKIDFATSVLGKRDRLSYLLNQFFPEQNLYIPQGLDSDYDYIYKHLSSDSQNIGQTRRILTCITQEALLLCLALPRAAVKFERTVRLEPILLSLNLKPLILPIKDEVRHWVNLRQYIDSPFVRPAIEDFSRINVCQDLNQKQKQVLEELKDCFQDSPTLYKIATHIKKKTLDLALLLEPAIAVGAIKMLPYQQIEKQERPLIACIDDSKSIQKVVKMTLRAGGFEVVNITEPATAMSSFVRQKPNLILMDINMPEIDGYKLAYMMRQSSLLKDIPIVMLTGRDGVLDRVKAKMIGAVGYICKPFNPQELLQSVQNHIEL